MRVLRLLLSGLLPAVLGQAAEATSKADGWGRCVNDAGGCPAYQPRSRPTLSTSTTGVFPYNPQRACFDVNVGIDTMYVFVPVTTTATSTSTQLSVVTTLATSFTTTLTVTQVTTLSARTTITTLVQSLSFSPFTTTVSFTVTLNSSSTTTFLSTISGSVVVPTTVLQTVTTTAAFTTSSAAIFFTSGSVGTQTISQFSTRTTTITTGAFAAAISIGSGEQQWSYFTEPCTGQVYDGDGTFTGGPNLGTTSEDGPLFLASNKHYRLYPCEVFEVSANYTYSALSPRNITSPLGFAADPAYGSALTGAFDTDSGFSFYVITTSNRAYAMYSRVHSWCPCVNATVSGCSGVRRAACGDNACRIQDILDDAAYPRPVDPCGCEGCPVTTTTATTSTTTSTTAPPVLKGRAPRRGLEKYGFDYYAFTYLIPIAYLTPGARVLTAVQLNAGAPSVSYWVNGVNRLTIRDIGSPVDPKFLLAGYGGTAGYPDFPYSVQLALGLLAITEGTDGRTACQGGVYDECFQGGQSIEDARYTFCVRAPVQNATTYGLDLGMALSRYGASRITRVPRPCCPVYG